MTQEFDDFNAWLKSPEGKAWAEQQMKEAATLADDLATWLKSPEGKAWAEQQMKEAATLAEEFVAEVKAGKFDLTHAELEQLNCGGFLG